MNKLMKVLGIVAVVSGLASVSFGATASNELGQSVSQTLASEVSAAQAVATVRQDQSVYPDQDNREGTIVRNWDFALDGINSGGIVNLGTIIPSNIVVESGYIQVITPITGITNMPSVGFATASDIKAASTNMSGAAFSIQSIIPVGTAATAVRITTNSYLHVDFTDDGSVTQGEFNVILKVSLGQ